MTKVNRQLLFVSSIAGLVALSTLMIGVLKHRLRALQQESLIAPTSTPVKNLGISRVTNPSEVLDSTERRSRSVARAKQKMMAAADLKSVMDRSQQGADAIAELCRAGFPHDAFDMIDMSGGLPTQMQVQAFFKNCGLNLSEAVLKIKALDAPMAPLHAIRSYGESNFKPEQITSLLQSPDFRSVIPLVQRDLPNSVDALNATFAGILMTKALTAKDAEQAKSWLDAAMVLHKAGSINDQGLADALSEAKLVNAAERWNLFATSIEGTTYRSGNPPAVEEARDKILSQMVLADGSGALNSIVAVNTPQGLNALESALKIWASNDPEAAREWYEKSATNLSPTQNDAVSKAYFKLAMNFSELDTAERWVARVTESELKSQLLDELARKRAK